MCWLNKTDDDNVNGIGCEKQVHVKYKPAPPLAESLAQQDSRADPQGSADCQQRDIHRLHTAHLDEEEGKELDGHACTGAWHMFVYSSCHVYSNAGLASDTTCNGQVPGSCTTLSFQADEDRRRLVQVTANLLHLELERTLSWTQRSTM